MARNEAPFVGLPCFASLVILDVSTVSCVDTIVWGSDPEEDCYVQFACEPLLNHMAQVQAQRNISDEVEHRQNWIFEFQFQIQ